MLRLRNLLLITVLLLPSTLFASEQQEQYGIVTDPDTGNTWLEAQGGSKHSWEEAFTYCEELETGNMDNWRLPTKAELESLVDYNKTTPAINENFTCQPSFYWSSIAHKGNIDYAWGVYCLDGADHWLHKSNNYYVRCIQDKQPKQQAVTYVVGTHSAIDKQNKLEWQKQPSTDKLSWNDGQTYCTQLFVNNKRDWRLPTIQELKSLVNYTKYYPAIESSIPCQSTIYWSSTTVADKEREKAWTVFFGNGDDIWKNKTEQHAVRCVREIASPQ